MYVLDGVLLDGGTKVSGGCDESSEVRITAKISTPIEQPPPPPHTAQAGYARARARGRTHVRGIVVITHAGNA